MKFIITIDTEADNQWKRTTPVSVENMQYIPRFQRLCDRFGFKPTYLCTYEIVQHDDFQKTISVFQEEGRAEVGAHLHPWTNPPYDSTFDTSEELGSAAYPCELPLDLFRNKMQTLTELIHSEAGIKPTSYRSGRWGFDSTHINVLLDLGYIVDSSVTPYTTWQNHIGREHGGPDYRRARNEPYFLDVNDFCIPGNSGLLEVPTTIMNANSIFDSKIIDQTYDRFRQTGLGRIFSRKSGLNPQWFRPYPKTNEQELIKIFAAAIRRKMPVIQMMFHSSELMPGGSPYYPTVESIDVLFSRLEKLFEYMQHKDVQGVTLSEFAKDYRALHMV